jgi:hypothetical protein
MTLENLLRIGKLKAHAAAKVEIDRIRLTLCFAPYPSGATTADIPNRV